MSNLDQLIESLRTETEESKVKPPKRGDFIMVFKTRYRVVHISKPIETYGLPRQWDITLRRPRGTGIEYMTRMSENGKFTRPERLPNFRGVGWR